MRLMEIRRTERTPPEPEGWVPFWHGYFQMAKVRSQIKLQADRKTHTRPKDGSGREVTLDESRLEQQVFLNIVADIGDEEISMFELGAGRGDWCLALAGVVDHGLIECRARRVRCLAVEGEPTHYQWTKEHFEAQGVAAQAVHGAVYSTNGTCRFKIVDDPSDNYGQSVSGDGQIDVPTYTVDALAERHGFDRIHIFHVDVQGAEVHALVGAKRTLLSGSPDYFIIGTHSKELNEQIRFLLSPLYAVLIDYPHRAGIVDTPFGKAYLPADGMIVLKRRKRFRALARLAFRIRYRRFTKGNEFGHSGGVRS